MANSLLTGISGLRGHQKMLEVVGNNLANLNTTAFKSSRVLFSDLMYEVQRNSSSTASGLLGSINGVQIGTGSRISQVDLNFQQGNLEATGSPLDVAIDGGGFFVGKSGNNTYYSRAGAFSLDEHGFLSDPSTGHLIQRIGSLGEPDGINPAFQTVGDSRIYLPKGATIPGKITETVAVKGNLNSNSSGPKAQVVKTSLPWLAGGVPVTLATKLSDLDLNTTDYITGDRIIIDGQKSDGSSPDSSQLVINGEPALPGDPPATTVGDLIAELNTAFPDSVVSLDADGNIVATANTVGPSLLNISIADSATNTGRTDFNESEFAVIKKGQFAYSTTRTMQVYDASGGAHAVSLEFMKQADGTWNITASIDPAEGTVLDGQVNGVTFKPDGSFLQIAGTGVGDANITLLFDGQPVSQTIDVSLGTPGSMDGLTQLGIGTDFAMTPDGFPPGRLVDFNIDTTGVISGVATNGLHIPMAQLAIASFANTDGLVSVGANYYQASLASGDAQTGAGADGERGAIRSAQLEGSNVDLALEFTRLIIAQRGFSANAKTITVTDQVLQELTSIIR